MKYACLNCAAIAALLLGIASKGSAATISNMWSISTAEGRPYVSATALERGVAYNHLSNTVYVVSRNVAPVRIPILEANTGEFTGRDLDVTGISGGTFVLNQIGVSDDGSIYAANLTTASGGGSSPFKIYRWAGEAAVPTTVYAGNPTVDAGGASIRFGDAIDVRGSGIDTEIIASTGGANATNIVAIFRPTDATLTAFTAKIVKITGAGLADFAKGVGFGPTNTFLGKNSGASSLRLSSYDYNAGTGMVLNTYSVLSSVTGVNMDVTNQLIAGVATANNTNTHALVIYDVSSGLASLVYSNAFPAPAMSNANVVGAVDLHHGRAIAVDTVNGVQMTSIVVLENEPPTITTVPGTRTIVEGGYGSISVGAAGTKPLFYQWYHNDVLIPDATNTTLLLTNLPPSGAGEYIVMVTNNTGVAYSSGMVTVTPAVNSAAMTRLWALPPGSRAYIANDSNQRGLAYNPARHHVLLVSRTGGPAVHVLDAETGAHLHSLDMTGVTGGTFPINMIACTSDGYVFAGNLTTAGTTTPFKLYRWETDSPGVPPAVVWTGDPGNGTAGRWGDNLDVRGPGQAAQALIGTRNGKLVALLDFLVPAPEPQVPAFNMTVADADDGNFGLSCVFGEGDTFWGKGPATPIRQVTFDPGTFQTTVTRVITNYNLMLTIGYDPNNQWIAGNSSETPDNVRLLDVEGGRLLELDTEFYPTDNDNPNGTGALRFGVNRLYTLDSNNGLLALAVGPKLRRSISGTSMTLTWDGLHTLQASPTVTGGWTNVVTGVSTHTVTIGTGPQLFYRIAD